MNKIVLSVIFWSLCLWCCTNSFGQSDSLRKVGWQHFKQQEYPWALELTRKAYIQAVKAGEDSLAARASIHLGIVFTKTGKYDSALKYNRKAVRLYQKIQYPEKLFHAYRNLALSYNSLGDLNRALAEAYQAAELAQKISNSPKLYYQAIELVGRILEELEEWEAAKKEYQIGLKWTKKHKLQEARTSLLNSLGNVQFGLQNWDSAIYYYQYSMKEVKDTNNNRLESYLYNNMGQVLIELEMLDSALFYLHRSLEIKKKFFPESKHYAYSLLAKAHIQLKQYDLAYDYLQRAYAVGQRSRDVEILRECEELWVSYYEDTGDYRKALHHMQALDSIRENVYRTQALKVTKQQAARQVKQREVQIKEQELQLENERRTKTITLSMAVVLFLLLLVLFHFYRKSRKLSVRNELLLKEQNHRVKNNLQMINSLLSLQSQQLGSGAAKSALNESQLRINSVALLHRMLYEGEQMGMVEIQPYLTALVDEVRFAAGRKMEVATEVPTDLLLSIEKATSLGLIVNELLTNSIKHVPDDLALEVSIIVNQKFSQLELVFVDNGPGVASEDWETSSSFGHQLIHIQIDQLRGRYTVTQQDGFYFKLDLKV